jgi:hypothetical protein
MKQPIRRTVTSLIVEHRTGGTFREDIDGVWRPARPHALPSIAKRFSLAWGVFTGRYDALDWQEHMAKDAIPPDPVKHCAVYRSEGCVHVDGLLCDVRDCPILKKEIPKHEFYNRYDN